GGAAGRGGGGGFLRAVFPRRCGALPRGGGSRRTVSPPPSPPQAACIRTQSARRSGLPTTSTGEEAMNETYRSDSAQLYKWVGTRQVRPDGVPKVTGRALYGADFVMPGMLTDRVLRSPHSHPRIPS